MIFGHVAAAIVIHHHQEQTKFVPLFIGSVFPDAGDKTIKFLTNIYTGRSFFHSFIGFVLSVYLIRLCFKRPVARSLIIGYCGHLVCDMGGDVPLLYPLISYQFHRSNLTYKQKIIRQFTNPRPIEALLVLWSLVIVVRKIFLSR